MLPAKAYSTQRPGDPPEAKLIQWETASFSKYHWIVRQHFLPSRNHQGFDSRPWRSLILEQSFQAFYQRRSLAVCLRGHQTLHS